MCGRILLLSFHLSRLVDGLLPVDPTITAPAVLPRKVDDRFIGYQSIGNTWIPSTCDTGFTWSQAPNHAQCCAITLSNCNYAIACTNGVVTYTDPEMSTTAVKACIDNYNNMAFSICNTRFIFEGTGDIDPRTNIFCSKSSSNWIYYRTPPVIVNSGASSTVGNLSSFSSRESLPAGLFSSFSSGSSSTAGNSPLITSKSSSYSSGAESSTITLSSQAAAPKKERANTRIVGIAVGPLVGLAFIIFAMFIFLRHRRKNRDLAAQQGGAVLATTRHLLSHSSSSISRYIDMSQSRPAAEMSDTAIFEAQSACIFELSGELKQYEDSTSAELAAPYTKPHTQD